MFTPDHKPSTEQAERCYVPVSGGQFLCSDRDPWEPIDGSLWRFANPQLDAPQHFIGRYFDKDCYAVEIDSSPTVIDHHWQDLRHLMAMLTPTQYETAARALQIIGWDNDHKFCGRCGQATTGHEHEMAKHCQPCDLLFYPRLSPCIITVITRGDEILLAHNPAFPAKFFSALAGFIEAGESIESALRREVNEEVGIKVGKIEYFDSQSWPFPGQLMIGFIAEYAEGEIEVDGIEIEEANWYRYDQLPMVPPTAFLAGQLIQHVVDRHSGNIIKDD